MTVAEELPGYAFIGGTRCSGGAGTFEVRSPYTGEVVNRVARCDARDVDRAIRAAREAQPRWLALPGSERAELLRRVSERFVDRAAAIARMITTETGKAIVDARAEVNEHAAPEYLRTAILRPMPISRPIGVVGVISPIGSPTGVAAIAIAELLAAGNTIVWKPSEQAPTSGAMVGELFERAGFPPGVVNVVHGPRDVAAAIVGHPDVDDLFFAGPAGTGGRAQIVSSDADIDAAVDRAVRGAFESAGDGATGPGLLLVHEAVHDEFTAKLRARAVELDGRPLASEPTRDRLIDEVDDAWTRGAEVHQYGRDDGLFHPATIVTGVTPDMTIARASAAGPVAPIIKVSSDAELDASLPADEPVATWHIVLTDADIGAAVDGAMLECFRLTGRGRGRTAAARLLVHTDLHDEFAATLRARAEQLRVGDPFDERTEVGPMSDQAAWERVVDQVDDAWTRGALVDQYGPSTGLLYPATIVTGVSLDMKLACTKTFGPVAPIIEISSAEAAVAIVNRSGPGSVVRLWTEDPGAAARVTAALAQATISLNDTPDTPGQLWPAGAHR